MGDYEIGDNACWVMYNTALYLSYLGLLVSPTPGQSVQNGIPRPDNPLQPDYMPNIAGCADMTLAGRAEYDVLNEKTMPPHGQEERGWNVNQKGWFPNRTETPTLPIAPVMAALSRTRMPDAGYDEALALWKVLSPMWQELYCVMGNMSYHIEVNRAKFTARYGADTVVSAMHRFIAATTLAMGQELDRLAPLAAMEDGEDEEERNNRLESSRGMATSLTDTYLPFFVAELDKGLHALAPQPDSQDPKMSQWMATNLEEQVATLAAQISAVTAHLASPQAPQPAAKTPCTTPAQHVDERVEDEHSCTALVAANEVARPRGALAGAGAMLAKRDRKLEKLTGGGAELEAALQRVDELEARLDKTRGEHAMALCDARDNHKKAEAEQMAEHVRAMEEHKKAMEAMEARYMKAREEAAGLRAEVRVLRELCSPPALHVRATKDQE